MAPTEGRVAKPEQRWDCRRGTPDCDSQQTMNKQQRIYKSQLQSIRLNNIVFSCRLKRPSVSNIARQMVETKKPSIDLLAMYSYSKLPFHLRVLDKANTQLSSPR